MSLNPTFEPLTEGVGLDIVDPVETRHFSLLTGRSVDPASADPAPFTFPVDTACRIAVERLRLPYMVPVDVRSPDGDPIASIDSPTTREFPDDDYLLELHSPIKVYMRVFDGFEVEASTERVAFDFGEQVAVEVGARSYHSAPGATITVPDDPEAMMRAVSAFSSALKTTSPERAWPTLRGHPPRIERGDELEIPEGLDAPETGITVSVPPEYWAVYTVAPLSYYLGAEVVPGEVARVRTETGVSHDLGETPAELNDAVESLLKRVFFLDCVVRTEGLYPDDLHERGVLESRSDADLDFAALYDAAPAERLDGYLDVPDEAVAAIESPWHRVTHVQPDPETVEFLPYVVNDLSLVRAKVTPDEPRTPTETQEVIDSGLDGFLRTPVAPASEPGSAAGPSPAGGRPSAGETAAVIDDFLRSAGAASRPVRRRGGDSTDGELSGNDGEDPDPRESIDGVPGKGEYVPLPETDALEQAWIGDGTPVRGTKLIREAFARETPEPSDGTIEIAVVCNDEEMREELDSVGQIYGSRDDMRVSVTCEFGVETGDLRDLLAEDRDVFHFIGHIDGEGFMCPDGILDAATVEEANATTALLNGCRSHDQGIELVKAGASAAIVSLSDLYNSGAVEVGETLARLLHHGFDIGSAMKIVREYTTMGNRYVVVGDPGVVVVPCDSGYPLLHHLVESSKQEATFEPHAYPNRVRSIGTNIQPYLHEMEYYYIGVGTCGTETMKEQKIRDSIVKTPQPLIVDKRLQWSHSWFKTWI